MAQTGRDDAAPTSFGRYETLFRIAAGGMAEVYAARVRGEAGFQKLVALKRMLPHLADDERFVEMFMDEGRLAANITSPNVVSTLDLGRAADGSLFLVMELVIGTTLSTLLRHALKAGDPTPPHIAAALLMQAARGLHDAHEARTPLGEPLELVHRDISPQNILAGVDGRVRITDFGVARAVLRRTRTSTGETKGKLSYFSPEQAADAPLDRRSDVFSLGVVAWEALTLRRLFRAENPLAVLAKVANLDIPLAHRINPRVPPELSAVVARALLRDVDDRLATARELAEGLREAAESTVGLATHEEVGAYVERFGGESLDRIQAQLHERLSAEGVTSSEMPPVARASAPQPDGASGVQLRDTGSQATLRRRSRGVLVGAAVALLGAGAAAGSAALFYGAGAGRGAVPTVTAPPTLPEVAAEPPAAREVPEADEAPADVDPRAEGGAAEPVVAATPSAAREEALETDDDEERATRREAERRAWIRRQRRAAARRQAGAPAAPTREGPARDPEARGEAPAGRRPGGLVDIGAFDDEIGR